MSNEGRDRRAAYRTVLLNLDGIEFANSGHRDVAVRRLTDCLLSFNDAIYAAEARGLERAAAMVEERYWTTLSPETKRKVAAAIRLIEPR